jgi:hypothetical protein
LNLNDSLGNELEGCVLGEDAKIKKGSKCKGNSVSGNDKS